MLPEATKSRTALRRTLAMALAQAACPKPEATGNFLIECVRSGNNPSLVSLQPGPNQIPLSTLSDRLGKVDLKEFLRAYNRSLEREAMTALRRFRPTRGEVYALLDGHEEEYWPRRGTHACNPRRCRNPFAHATYGRNKKSPFSHRWLFMGMTWKHGQDWITLPLRIDILTPLEHAPERQVENLALILKRLRIRPRVLLLDRGYDSLRVRQTAQRLRLPIGVRISFSHTAKTPRYVHLASTGGRVTIQTLLDSVAGDSSLKIEAWFDKRSGLRLAQRVRAVRVRFRMDEEPAELVLVAALKRVEDPTPRLAIDREHSMVLAFPLNTEARESIRRFRIRWNVEVLFNLMSQDRPQPRPKTIQAHVVQFCAFVHRICLGTLLRLAARLGGLFDAIAPERITTRVTSRWVIDHG